MFPLVPAASSGSLLWGVASLRPIDTSRMLMEASGVLGDGGARDVILRSYAASLGGLLVLCVFHHLMRGRHF